MDGPSGCDIALTGLSGQRAVTGEGGGFRQPMAPPPGRDSSADFGAPVGPLSYPE